MNLAKNIRELSLGLKFVDPVNPMHWGPEMGESLATYNDTDDFDLRTYSPPIDVRRQVLSTYPGWAQKIAVQSVDPDLLTSSVPKGSTPANRINHSRAQSDKWGMVEVAQVSVIRRKYRALGPALDERQRRLWAAAEAQALGRGGVAAVVWATGLAKTTVLRGLQEYASGSLLASDRVRRPGGGRKRATVLDPGLSTALKRLVEPVTRGDPMRPLLWTCKSTRRLSEELAAQGYSASRTLVANLLAEQGYSLQGNRKTKEGKNHPDRNAQFEYINRRVGRQLAGRQPAISVDTKKKELVGDFKNGGREWRPKGRPEKVRVHDFLDKKKGKAIPYGVYDLGHNAGWVSVGVDHDTAAFAVQTIRRWWRRMGCKAYPRADLC